MATQTTVNLSNLSSPVIRKMPVTDSGSTQAVLRDTNQHANLANILPTVPNPLDKGALLQSQYDIDSTFNDAARRYNTGLTTTAADLGLALRRARQTGFNQRQVGLSQAAESNLGWSPAVQGAAAYAAAQAQANLQATAQQDFATARGALQVMLDQARAAAGEQDARLTAEAARRKEYAEYIRTYGSK